MMPLPYLSDCSRPRAFALVITLAFLVLVTGVIVAFFSISEINRKISFTSANQLKADILARSAAEIVVGELREQITSADRSDQSNAPLAFRPLGSSTLLPHINGAIRGSAPSLMQSAAPAYGNLINFAIPDPLASAGSNALFPQGRPLLSGTSGTGVKTDTPSRNRRFFAAERQYETSTGLVQDPGSADPNAMLQPGHWAILTRSGVFSVPDGSSIATPAGNLNDPASPAYALGRFTYYVYNIGNALDANVAGGPDAASVGILGKNSVATADLTALTDGTPGGQPLLTRDQANALVQWRNRTSPDTTTYETYLRDFAIPRGFTESRHGDNLFFSRQDLLNYIDANVGSDPQDRRLAEYLTHFSRTSSRADLIPGYNSADRGGSGSAYRTDANEAASINRDALGTNLRVTSPFTRQNGQPASIGEPILKNKFPLERLDWIRLDGPLPGRALDIQICFGLVWDDANKSWRYTGPSGSNVANAIATLSEVATQNREPNFFELLKAGILADSLGGAPNPDRVQQTRFLDSFPADFFTNRDNHIVQIGANVIDQYDADSFPTRIQFKDSRPGGPGTPAPPDAIVGNEALPYFYRFAFTPYRPVSMDPQQNIFAAWMEPIFWNPSQSASAAPLSAEPESVRLRVISGSLQARTQRTDIQAFVIATPTAGVNSSVTMTRSTQPLSELTRDPELASSLKNAGANFSFRKVSGGADRDTTNFDFNDGTVHYLGFYLGDGYAEQTNAAKTHPFFHTYLYWSGNVSASSVGVGVIVVLEAQYPEGSYREIQRFHNASHKAWTAGNWTTPNRRAYTIGTNDPRTNRFGTNIQAWSGDQGLTESLAWTPNRLYVSSFLQTSRSANMSFVPDIGAGTGQPEFKRGATYRFADNSGTPGISPGAHTNAGSGAIGGDAAIESSNPSYTDPDDVQRPGDGWWSTGNHTLPMRQEARYRPVILNRPFTNVAELGYVYRDLPWKSLDFFSENSADASLLGLFCISEEEVEGNLVAGQVDLTTPHPGVLAAVLSGADLGNPASPGSNRLSTPAATAIAQSFIGGNYATDGFLYDAQMNPVANSPTELSGITAFLDQSNSATLNSLSAVDVSATQPVPRIKGERESIIRALSGSGQIGTWNLLIDVVAQSGRYPPGEGVDQSNFVVEGQKRYWLSIAIDRSTGKVIARQLEPVSR